MPEERFELVSDFFELSLLQKSKVVGTMNKNISVKEERIDVKHLKAHLEDRETKFLCVMGRGRLLGFVTYKPIGEMFEIEYVWGEHSGALKKEHELFMDKYRHSVAECLHHKLVAEGARYIFSMAMTKDGKRFMKKLTESGFVKKMNSDVTHKCAEYEITEKGIKHAKNPKRKAPRRVLR